MIPHSLFGRRPHCLIPGLVAVTLVALTWNSSVFCGQIHEAAQEGDLEKVKALLKSHPRLVFSKANGGTPLHYAAAHDHKDVAEVLLAYKADVNARDDDGLTPLFWAVEWGPSVVELLLVNHADVNAKDNDSLTPLHEATRMGRKHLVELLVAYKADVNIKDSRGLTPLHIAAAYDRTDVAEFLLANKAKVDAKANDGRTPLHVAAYKACKNVAELLLANKADINAKDKSDHTPLHYALNVWDGWDEDKPTRETRAKALVALLRQHGGHE
jgi:ankyrin repeat protein